LKYFLIQAIRSAVILTGVFLSLFSDLLSDLRIFVALLLKAGGAPLHFWLPPVIRGISLHNCLILITLQKIAPIIIIFHTLNTPLTFYALYLASILSAITGGIGGLNQTSIRKLIAFSSINHIAWMLTAISASWSLWRLYFFSYLLIASSVILWLINFQTLHIREIFKSNSHSPLIKILQVVSFLSLAGLPPLLGFLPKASIIGALVFENHYLWLLILLLRSLLTLFFYIRIITLNLTFHSSITKPAKKTSPLKTSLTIFLSVPNLFAFILPLFSLFLY